MKLNFIYTTDIYTRGNSKRWYLNGTFKSDSWLSNERHNRCSIPAGNRPGTSGGWGALHVFVESGTGSARAHVAGTNEVSFTVRVSLTRIVVAGHSTSLNLKIEN